MAKIDEVKEELNCPKVWLGIIVVTAISLIGWLVDNYDSRPGIKVYLDMAAIVLLTVSIVLIDKKIKARIKSLRGL